MTKHASCNDEQAFFDSVCHAFAHLPIVASRRLFERVSSAYRFKGIDVAKICFNDLLRRDLPIIEPVYLRYTASASDELAGHLHHINSELLRDVIDRFNDMPDFGDADIELLSQDISRLIGDAVESVNATTQGLDVITVAPQFYSVAANLTLHFKQEPPQYANFTRNKLNIDEAKSAIAKMICERWWLNHLRKYARRWREHLHITAGGVRRQSSPYCSGAWLADWENRRKRGRDIMRGTELEDEETGEVLNLLDIVDKSLSGKNRIAELMVRVKGFEQLAKLDGLGQENGYVGLFLTLNAPSKYHAYKVTGHRNNRYSGASPKDTQAYLSHLWRQIGATLRRRQIGTFGLRVSQPHHDATPHWHAMLFVHESQLEQFCEVVEFYATREDCEELKGKHGNHPRFEIKPIDENIGSPSAYIARHIALNVEGCAENGEIDKETGLPVSELAKNACAWASMWGIRQFQFVGGAPVTVWRELRSLSNQSQPKPTDKTIELIRQAANAGDWKGYIQLQGGPLVLRKNLIVRIWRQPKKDQNDYGETPLVIKGVFAPGVNTPPLVTRTRTYSIISKDAKSGRLSIARKSALTSWDRVNNCISNRKHAAINDQVSQLNDPDPYLKIPIQLEFNFGEVK